jgi:rod shape-determining protein MreD
VARLAYFPLIWAALLLSTAWPAGWGVGGGRPDFALLLTVWFGLTLDRREAWFWGWGVGTAVDILSVGPVGPHGLLHLGLALLLASKRRPWELEGAAVRAGLAAAAALVIHAAEPVVVSKLAGQPAATAWARAAGTALMTGLAAVPVSAGLDPMLRPRRPRTVV